MGGITVASEIIIGYSRWTNQLKQHFCRDYLVVMILIV